MSSEKVLQSPNSSHFKIVLQPILQEGKMNIEYTAQIWKEETHYIAHAMPLDVMSSGSTPETARLALDEAIHLFLSVAKDRGTLEEILQETGYNFAEKEQVSQ